jgi:hypothetical protein
MDVTDFQLWRSKQHSCFFFMVHKKEFKSGKHGASLTDPGGKIELSYA